MSVTFIKISDCPEFTKDFKKLFKRYRSLEEDLALFIKAQLYAFHKLQIDNHGLIRLNNLGFESPPIYKARKFACRALKGRGARSDMRIIYAYLPEKDEIHFIEIYSKTDKENEDRERIKEKFFALI